MEPLNLTVTNCNNCIVCVFISFWPYIKLFWFFKSVSDKNVRAVEFSALQLNSNQFYSSTWWHDIKTWLTDFICFLLTNTDHQTRRGKVHPQKSCKTKCQSVLFTSVKCPNSDVTYSKLVTTTIIIQRVFYRRPVTFL